MNLNTTKFFNSTDVNISSRMNEYLKKNFGYEVDGDIATLREAKKSLELEQVELKDTGYMNQKYVENMLMIETISSLLKAHGEKLDLDDFSKKSPESISKQKKSIQPTLGDNPLEEDDEESFPNREIDRFGPEEDNYDQPKESIKEEVQKINELAWIGWQIFRWGDYWGKNTTLHTELKYNGKHAYWLDSTDREYIEKIKNKLGKAISSGEHPHIRNWTGDHDDGSLDNPNQNIYKFDPEDMTPEERKDYELDKTEREEGFGSGPPRATVRDLSKEQKAELYNEEEELEVESINRLSKLAGV